MDKKNIYQTLAHIQQELKVPKNQVNKFGGFNYRSCEDILEAVKPLLDGLSLIISDEVVLVGDRYYIKAIVRLSNGEETIETTAFAREVLEKTKMDASQITGAASSYARKYALNGLFAIDDTKDADTEENSEENSVNKKTVVNKSINQEIQGGFQLKCEKCGTTITQTIADYSWKAFGGQELCLDCQKKERVKTMPSKMAKLINDQVDNYKK